MYPTIHNQLVRAITLGNLNLGLGQIDLKFIQKMSST